jgi:hypothetical protein
LLLLIWNKLYIVERPDSTVWKQCLTALLILVPTLLEANLNLSNLPSGWKCIQPGTPVTSSSIPPWAKTRPTRILVNLNYVHTKSLAGRSTAHKIKLGDCSVLQRTSPFHSGIAGCLLCQDALLLQELVVRAAQWSRHSVEAKWNPRTCNSKTLIYSAETTQDLLDCNGSLCVTHHTSANTSKPEMWIHPENGNGVV